MNPNDHAQLIFYDCFKEKDFSSSRYVEYALQFAEKYMDPRDVLLLKLRHGLMDGVKHTYKSIANKMETRVPVKFQREQNKFISITRARDIHYMAMLKLRHFHGRYGNCHE